MALTVIACILRVHRDHRFWRSIRRRAPVGFLSAAEVMLEFFHRLALWLAPVRFAFWLLGAFAVVGFGVSLFGPDGWREEAYTVLAMTGMLWAVLGAGIVYGFRPPLPSATPDAGRLDRLGIAVQRGLLVLFALFMSGLALAVVFATARSVGMLLRATGA